MSYLLFQQQQRGRRSPSPPRRLSDIFSSPDEFRKYLQVIDDKNRNKLLQTDLSFVLKCDKLKSSSVSNGAKQKLLVEMGGEFFTNPTMSKRLAMSNNARRDECKKFLAAPDPSKIPQHVWDALDEVEARLDPHFQQWLESRPKHNGRHVMCIL